MKKLILIIFTGLTFGMFSCEDILDLEPVSSLGYGSFWKNEESAKVAAIAIHADMRDWGRTIWLMGEVRSDMWGGVGTENMELSHGRDLVYQDISVEKVFFTNWANFYELLHHINDAIKYIPTIDFQSSDEKDYILGQVYGIRSYIYYVMVRTWGDVPLVLEPTESIDFQKLQKPRAPVKDVIDQIKNDLEVSLTYFGNKNYFQNNKRVYWSKAASLMLKGDVFIWSGTHCGGGTADYTQAKTALEELVGIAGLDLLLDFLSVFDYNNKNNDEIIYALDYELDQASNWYSSLHARQLEISDLYDSHGNKMGMDLQLSGGNRYHPSDEVLNVLFEDSLDQRGESTFIRLFRNPDATEYAASISNKFLGVMLGGARRSIQDVPIYRYSYGLLLLAEAKNLLGEDPSNEINRIRERAYGDNYDPSVHGYVNGTKDQNIEAILKEGLKEFASEGKRWWDLRRAGDEYVIKHNKYLQSGDEYKLLLPITREMIGRNPALKQTPEYGE